VTAVVYLLGALVFLIFADCEEQKWSKIQRESPEEEKLKAIKI